MSEQPDGPVTIDADAMLGTHAVEAGVGALAQRNRQHLASMEPGEQQEALSHWRELAVEVLAAARAAVVPAEGSQLEGAGRAVIVLEDQAEDEVAIHVTFTPQLEELEDGAISGTPAQITAMTLLDQMTADAEDGLDGPPPSA